MVQQILEEKVVGTSAEDFRKWATNAGWLKLEQRKNKSTHLTPNGVLLKVESENGQITKVEIVDKHFAW